MSVMVPRFISAIRYTLVIGGLVGSLTASASAVTVRFETDPLTWAQSGELSTTDSPHVRFRSLSSGLLGVTDANLFKLASVPGRFMAGRPGITILFSVPINSLALSFGNDTGAGARAVLSVYNQDQPLPVKEVTETTDGIATLNQTISVSGVTFDKAVIRFDSSTLPVILIDNLIFSTNTPPTADAGVDQKVEISHDGQPGPTIASVLLNGSGSLDPDPGDSLSYKWTEGAAEIAEGVSPTVPLSVGEHILTLTVTDSQDATSTDEVVVHVLPEPNAAPVAHAGGDQVVPVPHDGDPGTSAATFTLSGSGSDADGDAISTEWFEGSTSLGSSLSQALTRPAGTYRFTLKVTDSYGESSSDEVKVEVRPELNAAPVADAGVDRTVDVSGGVTPVTVSGAASSDPDGDALTYVWSENGVPQGSGPTLTLGLTPGTHTITLTVTDSYGASHKDEVVVNVRYAWFGVLQPVNADGTSVFRQGRTVPVKFVLTGASAGITNLTATLSVVYVGSVADGEVNEAEATGDATSGNVFRFDPSSGQYIFNWSTRELAPGKYKLQIALGDGKIHEVAVGLK
jgi:hypothetical protein